MTSPMPQPPVTTRPASLASRLGRGVAWLGAAGLALAAACADDALPAAPPADAADAGAAHDATAPDAQGLACAACLPVRELAEGDRAAADGILRATLDSGGLYVVLGPLSAASLVPEAALEPLAGDAPRLDRVLAALACGEDLAFVRVGEAPARAVVLRAARVDAARAAEPALFDRVAPGAADGRATAAAVYRTLDTTPDVARARAVLGGFPPRAVELSAALATGDAGPAAPGADAGHVFDVRVVPAHGADGLRYPVPAGSGLDDADRDMLARARPTHAVYNKRRSTFFRPEGEGPDALLRSFFASEAARCSDENAAASVDLSSRDLTPCRPTGEACVSSGDCCALACGETGACRLEGPPRGRAAPGQKARRPHERREGHREGEAPVRGQEPVAERPRRGDAEPRAVAPEARAPRVARRVEVEHRGAERGVQAVRRVPRRERRIVRDLERKRDEHEVPAPAVARHGVREEARARAQAELEPGQPAFVVHGVEEPAAEGLREDDVRRGRARGRRPALRGPGGAHAAGARVARRAEAGRDPERRAQTERAATPSSPHGRATSAPSSYRSRSAHTAAMAPPPSTRFSNASASRTPPSGGSLTS